MAWTDRLWEQIDRRGPDECWPWLGRLGKGGYGVAIKKRRNRAAHRLVYELLIGPIPPGDVLDHECHNRDETCPGGECSHRRCCNPTHLVARTIEQNVKASRHFVGHRTHCVNGHERTAANTYSDPRTGCRSCRLCRAEASRRFRRQHRKAA